MQEEIHVQKKYKNKEKIKCYEKKDMFLKVFLKTVSEAASLVVIGSTFHRRGTMTKKAYHLWNGEFWECGAYDQPENGGNDENYLKCYAKQYERKGILVKIHLNTCKYRLVIWNSHVDGQVTNKA